ncbi:MAGUK p55 subfamily member 3-like isoform X3 [Labeo rohita]|uniref:MAGUK p55 subfamily member 3-like isoform X3 n=1 Tax=Labeo rohita TaxID=84645 RepID=A0A498M6M5_LABRO|nr:MAGUK p55 subfamily member 3-like isoform X3 [Labeo rohita]
MKEAMPVLSAGAGLHETLALLTSQLRPDANHKEDMVFLKDVFSERSLSYLMKIHEKLRQYERQSPTPVLHSASALAEDVAEELQSGPMSAEEKELLHLLTSPHLKAVLSVHDTVAQKNFDPVLPPLPDDFEDELDEESVKIVRLVKNKEPLSQSQGSITLKIIPAIREEDKLKESKVYMRALFDYTPLEDKATPCQEAGLPFKRGDILQVVSQDDQTWWQAKRVGDCNLRAGLVPSKQFQERRLAYRIKMGTLQGSKSPKKAVSGLRRSFRLSRKDRRGSAGEANVADQSDTEFLTYEEVTRYQQKPNERPRLVVLIGSLGARINELKQKVIAENPHRYAVAVPHTTRPKKSHEKEGVEYHFVTKQAFDADAQNNKFIEYGEYKENLYGTSIEAIRSVQAKNKMCLVDVQPEALKALRTAEFKPYVIFVKPRIPESRRRRSAATSPGGGEPGRITEEDLQEMRLSAQQIDQQYGHLVDRVLIKEDTASACAELRSILERLERETFWVPMSWVKA